MKRRGFFKAALALALLTGCATKQTVQWVGCPMVSNDDKYTPRQGWLPTVEFGLRKDGVVVWRERKKP